jgi:hypothetical protein
MDQAAQTAPILLCSIVARFHLWRLLELVLPKVVVLSPLEIPPRVPSAVARHGAREKMTLSTVGFSLFNSCRHSGE